MNIFKLRFIISIIVCTTCFLQQAEAQKKKKPKVEEAPPPVQDSTPVVADTASAIPPVDTMALSLPDTGAVKTKKFMTGADQVKAYTTILKNKKVAVVVNQTSVVGNTTLLDTLLKLNINIVAIFTPEHGLKGEEPAGKKVKSSKIEVKSKKKEAEAQSAAENQVPSNIPVISLYGDHLKPTKKEMEGIDIVIFDIQDVGVRFYTYISTLHYVMEACAENEKILIVLDRPNPNGFYVDGPVLSSKFRSFVGMHPIPVVYGMTIGELANMMNIEGWIKGGPCRLRIIKMKNYSHKMLYQLPVWPSPNLTDMKAVYLYPSLCFFEGTKVSVGRGTDRPFQQIGYPQYKEGDMTFTPKSVSAAPEPMYKDTLCSGVDLAPAVEDTTDLPRQLNLSWLIQMYESYPEEKKTGKGAPTKNFFTPFFDKLAGTAELREQIQRGATEESIRASWQEDLTEFMLKRKRHLMYEDFGDKPKKGTKPAKGKKK